MKYQKNSLKKTVVVGTILVSSAFVFQVSAQTWANPACAPTGCNTPTPINVSGTAQTKAGNFILGGRMEVKNTAPQLWLNENDQTSASLGLWRFLGWEGNLHLYRNLSTTKDFATQSRVISILGANNNIGLGIEPTTKLDVNGQIKIRGGAPGLNKILASDADGLSTWKTKEELGIVGGGTDTSKWTSSGLNIFNKNTGNVGIGMNNPTSLLTVQGNSTKLSEVKIIGTNDTVNNSVGLNVDSARNAHVILDRGNTGQTSYVRHTTGGTTDWYAGINARQNSDYQISNTFNGEVGQLTIKKSNGNVGLGKNNPVTKLDVVGSGYFSSSLGVAGKAIVGGSEIKNSVPELWLNESDQTSAGLGLWRFQGWEGNFHLYRNTSSNKDFSTQSRALSILGSNNYVGIGIAPTAKLDVDGQVKIRGGAPGLNKILASDADGLSTWKTPTEIGISGSNWNVSGNNISNKNTGNVGVGISNPVTKLHVAGSGFFTGNLDVANNLNIADGDVLIGETPQGPPTATQPRLEVNGDIRFRTGTPAVNKILASTDASGSATWKTPTEIGIGGSNWTISGNNISNKNTGNVGVGISSPTSKLHVAGNAMIAGSLVSTAGITAMNDISAGGSVRVGNDLTVVGGNPRPDTILVSTNDSGLAAWKSKTELGITGSNWNVNGNNISNKNTGNVGIGTTNPTAKFDVVGDTRITGALAVSSFLNARTLSAESITLGTGSTATVGQIQTSGSKILQINPTGNDVVFNRNGGSVGIGTTPNDNYKLDVAGTGRFSDNLATDENLDVLGNSYTAGTMTVAGATTLRGGLTVSSGSPGAGKVLTSDASGNATWQNAGGGVSASQFYTAPQTITGDKGTASCSSGDVAVGGGIKYTGDRSSANFGGLLGIAEGQGAADKLSDGIFGFFGRGSITGSTNLRVPISRPGNSTSSGDVSSWYCEVPSRSGGEFVCYARCLNL